MTTPFLAPASALSLRRRRRGGPRMQACEVQMLRTLQIQLNIIRIFAIDARVDISKQGDHENFLYSGFNEAWNAYRQ